MNPQVLQQVAEPAKWLGETFGFWLQTLVLAISATAAIWVIHSSAKQERRRATIDAVIDHNKHKELVAARQLILKMHESGENNLSKYLDKPESEEYKAILLSVNTYEFMSSGIREGAFDEATYKRIRYSTVLKDWGALGGFIVEFRRAKKRNTLFQDFEWLHDRWKANPLKADDDD